MNDLDSAFLKLNQRELFVSCTGGDKPPLLAIHGHTDHGLCWAQLAVDMRDQYDVIMPDAVGHGRSQRLTEPITLHDMVDDWIALIEHLNLDRPNVVGHSMGAATAAMLAARRPDLVRAVALEDPPWYFDLTPEDFDPDRPSRRDWHDELAEWQQMSREALIEQRRPDSLDWTELDLEMWAESRQSADLALFTLLSWHSLMDWEAVVKKIECPMLLITAEKDEGALISPEVAQHAIKLAPQTQHLHFNDGVGHHIRRQRNTPYVNRLRTFLND